MTASASRVKIVALATPAIVRSSPKTRFIETRKTLAISYGTRSRPSVLLLSVRPELLAHIAVLLPSLSLRIRPGPVLELTLNTAPRSNPPPAASSAPAHRQSPCCRSPAQSLPENNSAAAPPPAPQSAPANSRQKYRWIDVTASSRACFESSIIMQLLPLTADQPIRCFSASQPTPATSPPPYPPRSRQMHTRSAAPPAPHRPS